MFAGILTFVRGSGPVCTRLKYGPIDETLFCVPCNHRKSAA